MNLAEFQLREVVENGVESVHKVFGDPEGGRRRDNEDVVGCACHVGAAETESDTGEHDGGANQVLVWGGGAYASVRLTASLWVTSIMFAH